MSNDPTEPLVEATQTAAQDDPETATVDAPAALPTGLPPAAGEPRPELLIGGAFLGGMIVAKLLGRRRHG